MWLGEYLVLIFAAVCTDACPSVTLAFQPVYSQINKTSDVSNKYGLEDGIVVRRKDGTFSMISAEMYADPLWVAMRLGIWYSEDAFVWKKVRSLRQSSANFNGTDQHSSSWGPFLVLDPSNNTYVLSYVGYRGAPSNTSGWLANFKGTIFAQYANVPGDAGLDSDFGDGQAWRTEDIILLEPDDFHVDGPWPHVCQGLQGTDSMYPFLLNDGRWAAFAGTSHQETPNPWPGGNWPVSLATADRLSGPWTRYNPRGGLPADAPCVELNGGYSENPIVSHRPDLASAFHLVMDFIGQEGLGFGYACSEDGLNWEKATLVKVPGGCRTPFGLLPLTDTEVKSWTPAIRAYGAINNVSAVNTSLQWLFYTVEDSSWENFVTAIVQLQW